MFYYNCFFGWWKTIYPITFTLILYIRNAEIKDRKINLMRLIFSTELNIQSILIAYSDGHKILLVESKGVFHID